MSFSPTLSIFSHHLRHEIPHLFRRTLLHLPRDVGVGAKRKSRVEVAEHTRYRFHIHAVLQRQGRECVSEVMKSQVFQPCVLQDFLVDVDHRIRVIHPACLGRWEHPRIIWVLLMLRHQQLDRLLRDGDFADGVFRFRARDVGFACVVASRLLADGNRLILDVQVCPLERHQLALAQAADEFQIEHGQDTALLGSRQVGLDLLRRQDFHFVLRNFRRYAVVRWISDNQAFLWTFYIRSAVFVVNIAHKSGNFSLLWTPR